MIQFEEKDIDQITSLLFISVHMADRAVQLLSEHYAKISEDSKEYLRLKKQYGKLYAKEMAKKAALKIIREDEKCELGHWLTAANELMNRTSKITKAGMINYNLEVKQPSAEMFDALMADSQMMGRIYLLMSNIKQEDLIKVESTLKLMGSRDIVRSELIDLFRPII